MKGLNPLSTLGEKVRNMRRNNKLYVIEPYRYSGMWVFDDPDVGLIKEAFVAGADTLMDRIEDEYGENFTLIFSDSQFPNWSVNLKKMTWANLNNTIGSGTYYYVPRYKLKAWLCDALSLYFKRPPKNIYAQVVTPSTKGDE